MNLLTIEHNRVAVSPEALTIKAFKDIWERDNSRNKDVAVAELSFVFYTTDYKSVYLAYDADAREQKVIADVIFKKNWKPDTLVKEAQKKYAELQQTPSMALLKDAEIALDKIRYYFRNIDIVQDVDGSLTKTLIANIEKLGGVIKGLNMLRELVDKEITENKRLRGSGTLGMREIPKKK
jgi:hypothetical protein